MATNNDDPGSPKKVLVSGIPESTSTGYLKLFFQNESKTGGGKLDDLDYTEGEEVAVLTYRENTVADRVLQKGSVDLKGNSLVLKSLEWDQRSVLIKGCEGSPDLDYLELFYESHKDSGGGPVENIESCEEGVIVTFTKPEDAQSVLRRKTVWSDCGQLTASVPTILGAMWDGKTVEVGGFTRALEQDGLKLIYEDKETSGGGPIVSLNVDYNDSIATIVFTQEEDASEVLTRSPVTWESHTLTARKPQPRKKRKKEKIARCIVVSGFTADLSESMLKLFFKNSSRSGGGPVKSIHMNGSKDKCAVEFEEEKTVNSVMEKYQGEGLRISGKILTVVVCDLNDMDRHLESPLMSQTELTKEMPPLEEEKTESSHVPLTESTPQKSPAEVAQKIETKPPVSDREETKEDKPKRVLQTETRALEVTGLPEICEETLCMFFEVAKSSGGGPIETYVLTGEERKAVITFKEATVCARVYDKYCHEGLTVEGTSIRVSLLCPVAREVDTTEQLETDLVCLQGVEEGLTSRDVIRYFENSVALCRVKCVTFGTKDGCALVEFRKFPGYDALYELACQKPLGRKMISADGVPLSASVEVYGAEAMSDQKVQMYFEHSRSEGGDVQDVQHHPDMACVIVTFQDYQVAKRVVQHRDHVLEKKKLIVKKHYDCIGVIPPDFDTSGTQKPPQDVTVLADDDRIIFYILKHQKYKENIDKEMTLHDAVVHWPQHMSSRAREVTVAYSPQRAAKSPPKSEDWAQAVKGHLQTMLEKLAVVDVTIQDDYWEEFYKLYKAEGAAKFLPPVGGNGEIEVDVNSTSHVITIVGESDEVSDRKAEIEEIEDIAVDNVNKMRDIVTEKCELQSLVKMKMLGLVDFFNQMEQKYADMKIDQDFDRQLVIVTGQKDDVQKVKMEIFQKCSNICTERFSVSKILASFLKSPTAQQYLEEKMKGHQVHARVYAVWEVDSDNVRMHAFSGGELNRAMDVFSTSILEETLDIPVTGAAMLETDRFYTLPALLKASYGDRLLVKVELKGTSYSVILIGCEDVHKEAVDTARRFIENNSIQHEFIAVRWARFSYIREYLRDDLENEVEKYRRKHQLKIKFSPNQTKPGFNVECNQEGLSQARSIIKSLLDQVVHEDHKVKKIGISKYFSDEKGQSYLIRLQARHKVIIQKDEEIDSDTSSSVTSFTIQAKATFPCGKTLFLATGDLTTFTTDAIVNAADPKLDHGGGVAKAIVDAGGQIIQTECTDYIQQRHCLMKPGDVYVSTAGKLPCQKVIHTVGPKWQGGQADEEIQLIQAVYASLKEAANLQFKCLSLPAISTGKYGFPQKMACDILVSQICGFLEEKWHHSVEEVYIIDNNLAVIEACTQSLSKFTNPGVVVDPKVGQTAGATHALDDTSGMADYAAGALSGGASGKGGGGGHSTGTSDWNKGTIKDQIVTAQGLRVSLVHGSIANQKADAVVNLTSRHLQLSQGAVSRMIIQQAGHSIQKECDTQCPRGGIRYGEVVITSGGHSGWQKIYHSAVGEYDSTARKDMSGFVRECLTRAHTDRMMSLALPSLGTGTLKFPPKQSASIIFEEVQKFSAVNKNSDLQDVILVVYDKSILQEFEDHMKELQQGKTVSSAQGHSTNTDTGSGSSCHWKQGPGKLDLTTTEGLDVVLIKGSLVDEQADAIVNLTSDDLNLSNGAVSKQILKKAGNGIQDECNKTKLAGHGDVVVTSGGNSPWKKIYHGACSHYHSGLSAAQELSTYIANCLNQAQADRCDSIAFPSLGTGSLKFPSDEVAGIMYERVREFSRGNPSTTVKTVKIVVYDVPVMKRFKSHVADLLSGKVASESAVRNVLKRFNKKKTGSKAWKTGSYPNEIITGNGIAVEVCGGDVVTQKVDVIVNLTSKKLDLSQGFVSKEIVNKGGKQIQDELNKKRPGGIEHGQMVETSGGTLQCQVIYHGACSGYHQYTAKAEMSDFVSSCLHTAHMANYKSMAFPSLGTGSLKFPPAEVARIMFKCVLDFSHKYSKTSVKRIKFVVYDTKDKKEFEKEVQNQLKKAAGRTIVRRGVDDFKELMEAKKASIRPGDVAVSRRKEVLFRLYGKDRRVLKEVIKQIDETCNKEIREDTLESALDKEAIANLSPDQVSNIQHFATRYEVNLDLQQAPVNRIVLQGLGENVQRVSMKIQEIFRVVDKHTRHEEEVHLLAQQTQWQFEEADSWEEYDEEINAIIEKAYLHKDTFAQWEEKENDKEFKVRIDFAKMRETTIGGPQRDFKVKRHVEGAEGSDIISLPDTWVPMKPTEVVTVKQVAQGSAEYTQVKATFDDSMKRSKVAYKSIVEIQRVQNPKLYRTYMTTKADMEQRHKSKNPLERTAWHATNKEVLSEINANGFNRNFSGDKHGAWYGKGAYFATEAGTSATMYSGKGPQDRYMYQCKILTGDYTKGSEGIKTAPPKDPSNPSIKYDSVVDRMASPKEWVIFTDSQCWPQYVVTFKME